MIDKNSIRDQQDSFLSDCLDRSRLVMMSPSGSTGTPFACYQGAGKRGRVNAESIASDHRLGLSFSVGFDANSHNGHEEQLLCRVIRLIYEVDAECT